MASLSGTIVGMDGTPEAGRYVRFQAINSPVVSSTVLGVVRPVDVQLDEDGEFTVTLMAGTYWVVIAGIQPFMILLSSGTGTYRIENVVVWPVQAVSGTSVWIKNPDDGLYYRITSSGTGNDLGIVVDPNPSANPTGFLADTIWLLSDDGLYYQTGVSGSGASLGMTVDTDGQSVPAGTKMTSITVPSIDGDWTNRVTCVGSGSEVGLIIS